MATASGSPLDLLTGKTREMRALTAVPVSFSGLTKPGPLLEGLSDTEQTTGSMEKRWRQMWTQLSQVGGLSWACLLCDSVMQGMLGHSNVF